MPKLPRIPHMPNASRDYGRSGYKPSSDGNTSFRSVRGLIPDTPATASTSSGEDFASRPYPIKLVKAEKTKRLRDELNPGGKKQTMDHPDNEGTPMKGMKWIVITGSYSSEPAIRAVGRVRDGGGASTERVYNESIARDVEMIRQAGKMEGNKGRGGEVNVIPKANANKSEVVEFVKSAVKNDSITDFALYYTGRVTKEGHWCLSDGPFKPEDLRSLITQVVMSGSGNIAARAFKYMRYKTRFSLIVIDSSYSLRFGAKCSQLGVANVILTACGRDERARETKKNGGYFTRWLTKNSNSMGKGGGGDDDDDDDAKDDASEKKLTKREKEKEKREKAKAKLNAVKAKVKAKAQARTATKGKKKNAGPSFDPATHMLCTLCNEPVSFDDVDEHACDGAGMQEEEEDDFEMIGPQTPFFVNGTVSYMDSIVRPAYRREGVQRNANKLFW
eukprot:TRINITY_DN1741_c0_g1_i1.p1 TRINITY_DN1741_c0_g1~~TRINITY_DN1741_c0_g1_i1.p1  ORF type:complete len:456 (+),score=98.78 TRINITY_DN1741_c0_g1_i1:32-1369(+)